DILTGLPNRALLNQRLKQIVAQAARNDHQVACLFLDFDHFKRINDTLGHDAGDQLLQAVAQRLTSAVRESDTGARLGGDEFFLVYQPQIDMDSGRALGVEALLRWRDPERGVISPAEFIPIAEESGMIQALGARVLRDACRQLMAWHRQGMMLRLSVNLSVQQLQHDSWLSVVEEALKASGLPSRYPGLAI